jgi:glutamate---cysteine ligase / carboxylate-amine ligase
MRKVGMEEELLLVHPGTGVPKAVSGAVLSAAGGDSAFTKELQRTQLEYATEPHTDMAALDDEVRRWRKAAARRAQAAGASVAALASSPLDADPDLTTDARYQWMAEQFGVTALEQLACGCHVHVEIASDEEGVGVLDRIRPWLAPLLALSANSPYWQGTATGYESYRSLVWTRWPSAGPTEEFGSARQYHARVRTMLDTGVLLDEGMVYFDARLSRSYPTIEVRVADVCLEASDAVLVAALVRGLVETAAHDLHGGRPPHRVHVEELRLASWRAARSGLTGDLVHPLNGFPVPAATVLGALVDHAGHALEQSKDLALVQDRLAAVLDRGNGAQRQRAVFAREGSLGAVVADAVARTAA